MAKQVDVVVLGATGNFGHIIVENLVKSGVSVLAVGRSEKKLASLQVEFAKLYSNADLQIFSCDVYQEFSILFQLFSPKVLINTIGPFQDCDYQIPVRCIENKVHYIDIADARNYVCGINELNCAAQHSKIAVVVGASSVPVLSSAVLVHFSSMFARFDAVQYGISPGLKTERGLATTQSILSYIGKPFKVWKNKQWMTVYGWQNCHRVDYPGVGKRWMGNCDIPDLTLFPEYFQINNLSFSAGIDNVFLHVGLWLFSWLVRCGLIRNFDRWAKPMLKISKWFDRFGSDVGVMHVKMQGENFQGNTLKKSWYIIARKGHGLQIPCVPAIVLAKKILAKQLKFTGAAAAVGLISLEEYLEALHEFEISTMID